MIGAVDIGGTKIAVGVVDDTARVIARSDSPTASERGFPEGLARIIAMLRKTAARAGAQLDGIGIGSTGPVDPFTGVFGSVDLLPGWQGGAIVAGLADAFQVPVAMENDADAAGLAEAVWGAGRGKRRFLYVTVGTGIGVAIVLDGALYRGVDGAHPEIGHQVIDASGPRCYCGANGCWETLAAGPALLAETKARMGDITMIALCNLAETGDSIALSIMDREGYYLGLGLANLVSTFCPDMIALGGGVMESGHLFLDRARQVVRRCCTMVPFEKTVIARAELGANAALVGAAEVWHHRFGSARRANAI